MTKTLLGNLWRKLIQKLLAVDEAAPPYPLTLDEWTHVQRQEEQAHLTRLQRWKLEELLRESGLS